MERYFEMKFWTEYIVPIIIFCFLALIMIIYISCTLVSTKIKYDYLKKQGYKRVPYVVNSNIDLNAYKWVKGDKSISESRVDRMRLSALKEYVINASEH